MATKRRKGSRAHMIAMKVHRLAMNELQESRAMMTRAQQDDAKRKAGFRFRLDAWIHPMEDAEDGDDFMICHYFRDMPHPRNVQIMLAQKGSAVVNDYVIVDLLDAGRSILAAAHAAGTT